MSLRLTDSANGRKLNDLFKFDEPPRIGSLCTGYGGLDIAVHNIWGGRIAWYCEFDPYVAIVSAAHIPNAPNLGDVNKVDWSTVEQIEILTAGYPCQPFSSAGYQLGFEDSRNVWPGVVRTIRALRPRVVILENVAAHLGIGFDIVLWDLAESGYDARWYCVSASDAAGTAHKRERVFVVAYPNS